jgi:diacylglycerol kinase
MAVGWLHSMRVWVRKFQNAFRGVVAGTRGQSSFVVHVPAAGCVLVLAAVLRCEAWQWCVLLLAIGLVLAAELANSALEELARGVCPEHNEHVGRALDIASGAVLVACSAAALVGTTVFLIRLQAWWG